MPTERLTMRKIKEILRLRHGLGFSVRQIARSCSMSHGGLSNYLQRAQVAHILFFMPVYPGARTGYATSNLEIRG
jgi:predicted AAA+ superfamily ATPase